MNFKKSKKLLKKITVLHDTLLSSDEGVSNIEKDLLLSYTRDLYDIFLEGNSAFVSKNEAKISENELIKSEPIIERPPVEVKKTVRTQTPVTSKNNSQKASKSTVAVVEPTEVITQVPKVVNSEPSYSEYTEEMIQLFAQYDEISKVDRLSMLPIHDMSKSMGINEKIYTVKELFGGEQNVFDETMQALNGFDDYTEASDYLKKTVASKFGWDQDNKVRKASNFVKLVRRRYI